MYTIKTIAFFNAIARPILLALAIAIVFACSREKEVPPPTSSLFRVPTHFPPMHYNNPKNPFSEEGVLLGRSLFYDESLSSNNLISCASCHHQANAFSDPGKALSEGVYGRLSERNSPALFNLAWNTSFMWDGGVNHIEIMPVAPFVNPNEMNISMREVIERVNANQDYRLAFKKVFGIDEINDKWILYALAQFMSVMISDNSKYDKYIKGQEDFTASELKGLKLFNTHCASCHKPPLFTDFSFRNNGFQNPVLDSGRFRITQNPSDIGKFKVPSLRNSALTWPYMHDGQLQSLADVVEHYANLDNNTPLLDTDLKKKIVLNEEEKADLLAFLETLTDYEFIHNPMFSKPK